jgi:hypothetical protein
VTDSVPTKAAAAVDSAADAAAAKVVTAADSVAASADKAAHTGRSTAGKAAGKVDASVAAVAGKAADTTKPAEKPVPARSLDEIETDLDATRARLAQGLDDLQAYVSPKNVIQRQVDKAKGVFVDQYGGIKPERVAMAAGAVVAVVVVLRLLRGGSDSDED